MKLYDQKVSKGLSVSSAALLAVVLYLVLTAALNLGQLLIDPTGESYSSEYGIAQFIIGTLYWIIMNYCLFSRRGRTGPGAIVTYLVLTMLPITCFTIATSVIVEYYPTTDFLFSWNLLTWLVAPTLFWTLPFSYVYYAFGYYLTMPIYLAIVLIYNVCIQSVGIILGLARISYVLEKENSIKRQRERKRQMEATTETAFESVTVDSIRRESITGGITMPTQPTSFTGTNPFMDESEDEEKIIYTEALDIITDDMIREETARQQAIREEQLRQSTQNTQPQYSGYPQTGNPYEGAYGQQTYPGDTVPSQTGQSYPQSNGYPQHVYIGPDGFSYGTDYVPPASRQSNTPGVPQNTGYVQTASSQTGYVPPVPGQPNAPGASQDTGYVQTASGQTGYIPPVPGQPNVSGVSQNTGYVQTEPSQTGYIPSITNQANRSGVAQDTGYVQTTPNQTGYIQTGNIPNPSSQAYPSGQNENETGFFSTGEVNQAYGFENPTNTQNTDSTPEQTGFAGGGAIAEETPQVQSPTPKTTSKRRRPRRLGSGSVNPHTMDLFSGFTPKAETQEPNPMDTLESFDILGTDKQDTLVTDFNPLDELKNSNDHNE